METFDIRTILIEPVIAGIQMTNRFQFDLSLGTFINDVTQIVGGGCHFVTLEQKDIGHKCVTGGGVKNVSICVTSFMNVTPCHFSSKV